MSDLSTTWLGLPLRTPLVSGPSPLAHDLDGVMRLEEAGAAAIVLPSLFEEQITRDQVQLDGVLGRGAGAFAEAAAGYFPDLDEYNLGPDRYLALIAQARARCAVPVIGSLNCSRLGEWTRYARWVEDAGASAIELNLYDVPVDPAVRAADVERAYAEVVGAVREATRLPVAVKLAPYFTALPALAAALVEAGADGLVLFNRLYQPDLDLETLRVTPRLVLSAPVEASLPLRWVGILHGRVDCDLAATGGVHDAPSALKALLVGASCVMMASALLRRGPGLLRDTEREMARWMDERGYGSVTELIGSASMRSGRDPAAFERANYLTAITNWAGEHEV
jgi:dihydroorotate dehydrogenase (fumarate)